MYFLFELCSEQCVNKKAIADTTMEARWLSPQAIHEPITMFMLQLFACCAVVALVGAINGAAKLDT